MIVPMEKKKKTAREQRLIDFVSSYPENTGPISSCDIAIEIIQRLERELKKTQEDLVNNNKYWLDQNDNLENKNKELQTENESLRRTIELSSKDWGPC